MAKRSIRVIEVQHASRVAAVQTAAGPRAILSTGLLDALASSGATADVVRIAPPDDPTDEVGAAFHVARQVRTAVREAVAADRTTFVLSGACHTALGSTAGLPAGRRGVVWVDSHPDFNTPDTSESGLLDGMILATLTGRCWTHLAGTVPGFVPVRDEDVLLVGARSIDAGEERLLSDSSVGRLSIADARDGHLEPLEDLAGRVDALYLHLDLDVLDTSVGTANGYASAGGFTAADLEGFLSEVSSRFEVWAMGFTSYDPAYDPDGSIARAAIGAARVVAG